MSRRTERIGSLVQIELGTLLLRKTKDPRLGFVTVTDVEMTDDLKFARVYYRAMNQDKQETQRALEHAAGYLQHEIAVALKLRFTPKLSFHWDESLDQGLRIERILEQLKKERGDE